MCFSQKIPDYPESDVLYLFNKFGSNDNHYVQVNDKGPGSKKEKVVNDRHSCMRAEMQKQCRSHRSLTAGKQSPISASYVAITPRTSDGDDGDGKLSSSNSSS